MIQSKRIVRLIVFIGFSLLVIFNYRKNALDFNPTNVNLIDANSSVLNRNFSCVKTKEILNLTSTTICIYMSNDVISKTVIASRIWEENQVKFILKILIANPEMIMIDIGANIGSYSMFTAGALRRLTIAIDCYLPNIERIAKAARLERVQDRIVLIHNALYEKSGEELQIRYEDPSGIRLNDETYKGTGMRFFTVKTIEFDDLLPILRKYQVKTALIKIDIETSESYMCQTGEKIFDEIDISFVMMEWHSWRVNYQSRYRLIVDFFTKRNYLAMNETCGKLQLSNWLENWPGNIYWIKTSFQKNFSC